MINWSKIKNEYINTPTSYRKLSEKYKVSVSSISKRAQKEDWVKKKKNRENKLITKVQQITVDRESERIYGNIQRIMDLSDEFLNALERAVREELDSVLSKRKVKVKEIEYNYESLKPVPTKEVITESEEIEYIRGQIDTFALMQLSVAFKNVRELYMPGAVGDESKDGNTGVILIPTVREIEDTNETEIEGGTNE